MKIIPQKFFLTILLLIGFLANLTARTNKVQYHTNSQIKAAFEHLQNRYPKLVHLSELAKTRSGELILLVRVGNGTPEQLDSRTGILIVGEVEGDHLVGSEVSLGILQEYAKEFGRVDSVTAFLKKHVIYVIPRLNPEGAHYFFKAVKWDHPWNNTPTDEDHDGFTDEDGPEDLNGDGLITLMRKRDPEGTYFPDPKNPELLRKADAAKGETGIYKIYVEGRDNDGDGFYNEDGVGGVNIDWNFPQEYQAFKVGSGKYTESEPETRSISEFLFNHRNIVLVLTYSLHDNLIRPPKLPQRSVKPASGSSSAGRWRFSRRPKKNVDGEDIPYFNRVSRVYKKLMQIPKGAEPVQASDGGKGSFYKWVYFQYGVPDFTTSLMLIPKPSPKAKGDSLRKKSSFKQRSKMQIKGIGQKEKDSLRVNRQWLAYFKNKGITGFVPWKPFRHPQLGNVEIGGFAPFLRTTAPATAIPGLIEKQASFVAYLMGLLPEISVENLTILKKADQVYSLSLFVKNTGYLPTATAFGAKTRLVKPVLVKIFPEKGELLSGQKIVFIPRLNGSGASRKVEWLLHAPAGTKVTLKILSEKAGSTEKTIFLKETKDE